MGGRHGGRTQTFTGAMLTILASFQGLTVL